MPLRLRQISKLHACRRMTLWSSRLFRGRQRLQVVLHKSLTNIEAVNNNYIKDYNDVILV